MAKTKQLRVDHLERNAADAQIRDLQRDVDYDTKDFTIDYIIQEFQKDYFYIPEYQRKFVWDNKRRRRFIESVLLGLPIPFLFLAEMDDGRLEIVDGAQRIQTLEEFVNGDLQLQGLEKLPALNGFRFSDLSEGQQRKFKNRALRMIVLDAETSLEIRQDIFDRINTGSLNARASEIRKGALGGAFYKIIQTCAADPDFLRLCPITDSVRKRGEAEELVLRFFAYSDEYQSFRHDVAHFLDAYIRKRRDHFDSAEMKRRFGRMIEFVSRHFPHGFAKSSGAKTTPRVRFEAIAVGVHLALDRDRSLVPRPVDWLESDEFKHHTTTHASNSGPKLKARVEYVRNQLLGKKA
ncbi:MAG TPA: DUF262 domain-containing protein [Vicinamibacterales bacterium]|nr:DUF262 domain-containing protein [Vicinamibacterales bacterium]